MDTNAPFYPIPIGTVSTGISYYDWIAAVAMQALTMRGLEVKADRAMTDEERDLELAARAYKMADAMLHARAQTQAERAKRHAEPRATRPAPRA
ncbi:MAG: hypothetical protein ACYC6N_32635 [Pirellulaceae bacterium]